MPASLVHHLTLAAAALVLACGHLEGHSNQPESCSPRSKALLQVRQHATKRPDITDPLRAPLGEDVAKLNSSTASLLQSLELRSTTQTDAIATSIVQQVDTTKLMSSTAGGVSSLAGLALAGAPAEVMKSHAISTAVSIVSTAASMVNPLLGVVVTLASSIITGMFGGSSSSPMTDLYNQIMAAVADLIQQTLIENQMDTVKDQLSAISEELLWVPDLVESSNSSDVELSYFLTVQHDLAVSSRYAFGDCYDDRTSSSCQSWEEAGSLYITNVFAMTHLDILASLYSLGIGDAFNAQIQSRLTIVGKKYRCLLKHSWQTYKDYRLSHIAYTVSTRRRRVSCNGRSTERYYQCVDSWTGTEYYGETYCSRDVEDSYKNAATAECVNQQADGALKAELVQELKLFENITDFLSATEKSSACD